MWHWCRISVTFTNIAACVWLLWGCGGAWGVSRLRDAAFITLHNFPSAFSTAITHCFITDIVSKISIFVFLSFWPVLLTMSNCSNILTCHICPLLAGPTILPASTWNNIHITDRLPVLLWGCGTTNTAEVGHLTTLIATLTKCRALLSSLACPATPTTGAVSLELETGVIGGSPLTGWWLIILMRGLPMSWWLGVRHWLLPHRLWDRRLLLGCLGGCSCGDTSRSLLLNCGL